MVVRRSSLQLMVVVRPVFQPMSQPVVVRSDEVRVSAVSVDVTRRRVDRTMSTVSDSVMVVTEELQHDSWTRSGSDLPLRGESAVSVDSAVSFVGGPASTFLSSADGCADFAGEVAVVVTSPVVLACDVAVRVTLPAVAGAASPADLAEVVASLADDGMVTVGVADLAAAEMAFSADPAGVVIVGVASLADAGMVTVGVSDLADARAVSLADAGMAFPADPAGVVTVGVASLADAGLVTVGVTDLADARAASLADSGMALPADLAGVVTVGVVPLADAGLVTVGVTDLTDAGAAYLADAVAVSLADPAGNVADGVMDLTVPAPDELPLRQGCVVRDDSVIDDPEYSNGEMTGGCCVSPGVWCQEMPQIQNDSDCHYVDHVRCVLVGMDYAVLADGYTCSFEMLLSEPLCAVTDDMTCQENIEALSGTVYDCDDVNDNQLGYFDYDDQRDYEEWCGWNDPADDNSPGYFDHGDPHVCEEWCSWDCSVVDGSVSGDSEVVCGDCMSAETWCQGGQEFVTIRAGNVLAMWAVIRIVWTSLYRRTMTETCFEQ